MLIARFALWLFGLSSTFPKFIVYTRSSSCDIYPTPTSVCLHALRFGFVRTVLFVRTITQAGTGDACFIFFINRVFRGPCFRAAIKLVARQALFK
jgi:hypothetical protein